MGEANAGSGSRDLQHCLLSAEVPRIRVKKNGEIRSEDLERIAKSMLQAAWRLQHNKKPQIGIWDDGTEGFNYRFGGRGTIVVLGDYSSSPLAVQLIEAIRKMAPGKIRVEGEGTA
jgi:hypothetical protein